MHSIVSPAKISHLSMFMAEKNKRKLKLLIASANFVLFVLLMSNQPFLFCFVNIFLEKLGKKVYS